MCCSDFHFDTSLDPETLCCTAALTGLTRVRRFQQDDAHIFCRPAQVSAEVSACLRMMGEVRALC